MHATETSLPLVSIIMPAFNGEPYIGAAIRSVLAQSYARWGAADHDDGSADQTAEIAEAFEKSDPRIRLFRNPKNLGAAQTRNRGFALTQGEWIALLDCDDIWHTDKLEKQLALASRGDILYCSYALIDESGKHLSDFLVPESTDYEAMLRESVLSCSTVLLRRSILAGQRFPTEYYHEDYVFWLRTSEGRISGGRLHGGAGGLPSGKGLPLQRQAKCGKKPLADLSQGGKAVNLEIRSRFCSLCLPCAAEAQEGTMKVLLLSHNPVTTYNNMGKTFLSLFPHSARRSFASSSSIPLSRIRPAAAATTASRIAKRCIPSGTGMPSAGEISPDPACHDKFTSEKEERTYRSPRSHSEPMRLVRDLIWRLSRWDHPF